jgi:phosphopantothenoylcysteine decarboxylase / phosphopantothenate---cysteine ligase
VPPRPLNPRAPWADRRVVLGVSGGIAAYKAVQVARDLTRLGSTVDVVATRSATAFVRPLSFQAVTGREVHTRLLSGSGVALHLRLAAEADLVLVAPATADLIARAAQGRANDLLTTVLLATRAPVLLAPAMNDRMYGHTQTARNLAHCREVLGYRIAGPATGPLAFGEGDGPGRMLEPDELVEHAGRLLGTDPAYLGRRVLVTAGPTREAVDPVRALSNRSSGRMGFALAREAWLRGGDVTLVTGPSHLPDLPGVHMVWVETAVEMLEAVRDHRPEADLTIFAAAVSDYRPAEVAREKWKREDSDGNRSIPLVANPDVSRETSGLRKEGSVTVGFALETERLEERARRKLEEKGFDLIVANDPGEEGSGFDVSTNRVTLLHADGEEEALPLLDKHAVARAILDRLAAALLRAGPSTNGGPE